MVSRRVERQRPAWQSQGGLVSCMHLGPPVSSRLADSTQ
jgi:hypothetical protein